MPEQLNLFSARQAAQDGARRAVEHADKVCPDWSEQAASALVWYAQSHQSFLAEEVRGWAEAQGLPRPPDKRAWGAVITRARAQRIIYPQGCRPAVSSRGGFKTVWHSTRCQP